MSERDPAAEAAKMLREMKQKPFETFSNLRPPLVPVLESDLLALLRELVERREGDRWIPCSEKMPLIGAHVQTYDPTYSEHYRINTGVYGGDHSWVIGDDDDGQDMPTHWRPLPAPPAEEKTPTGEWPTAEQIEIHNLVKEFSRDEPAEEKP